jgi:hypothetical protein
MASISNAVGFHEQSVAGFTNIVPLPHSDTRFTYVFQNFFHPFVGELIAKLNRETLSAIFDPAWLSGLQSPDPKIDPTHDFFQNLYQPQNGRLVQVESTRKEIDLTEHGPYAIYNWELFFHIPLTIAVHLSKTRRFAEAQSWFHYIFDPTANDKTVDPPARFWKFLAFRQEKDVKQIDALLTLLSKQPAELSAEDQQLRADILAGYLAILSKPFQPHAVARTRHLAYQYSVVMKYLDNLIAWGDDLFQQDTIESINEATQLYVLAFNLLGPRPQQIPPRGTVQPKTFAQLKAGLDAMGNALVELESNFPFNVGASGSGGGNSDESAGTLFGIGRTLYFCVPRNDKLLGYWDTVAGRLSNIRHCMNIQGVVRPLALFDPPIDPGMLVKATAAGLDLTSITNGLTQPVGPVRCAIMLQKALEICAEVRGLGNSLLSAMEKGDAEHLALVRQRHEIQIQKMAQDVRFLQWKQTQETTESLLRSRATALERYRYYQRLLGISADTTSVPDALSLDRRELTEDNFDDTYAALVDQYAKAVPELGYPELRRAPESLSNLIALTLQTGALHLNLYEFLDINVLGPAALVLRSLSSVTRAAASVLVALPDGSIAMLPLGTGMLAGVGGGTKLADAGESAAGGMDTAALVSEIAASYASKAASYQRRADEWVLQHNLAARELMQIGRAIIGSLIAEQIAYREYQNVQQQIVDAQEVDQLLHDKFTDEDLYLWMQGEISRLYYEYYRFAFDTAGKAERTMKQELMRPELDAQDFVKFNYWDGGRRGLLSGEALHLDVKRMEMAYLDNNKRELELTRHVSLRQLDPLGLLTLKSTGTCTVTVPEWLYDRDCPGHYLRRIKNVALSIPSVVGPYTSVHCTLSLLRSSLRKSPALADGEYARQGADDDRFVDYIGAVQSIVTSGANADSGLFETSVRDDRFLPFEGAGAESTWKLELPQDYPAFDYATISDVILHIRYTARQGVDRTKVQAALHDLFQQASQVNLALLFSLRHDFPTEWSAFVNGTGDFIATIRRDHFPYFTQGKTITIVGFDLYGRDIAKHHTIGDPAAATAALASDQQFVLSAAPDAPGPTEVLTRTRDGEVFLILRYSL